MYAGLQPKQEPEEGELPSQVDVRQMSLFGAGWTLGSFKHLAENGAAHITHFETAGRRGLVQGQKSPRNPEFKSGKGWIFPVYYVLKFILQFKGGNVIKTESSDPLIFNGILCEKGNQKGLVVVNHTGDVISIQLPDLMSQCSIWTLCENTFYDAVHGNESQEVETVFEPGWPIRINPYGITFIQTPGANS